MKAEATLIPTRGPETFDADLDRPEYHHPGLLAQIDEMVKKHMTTSPQQTVEAALEKYEENYMAVKNQRWDGQRRWQGRENEEMRLVRIMHPHSVMRALRHGGVDARIDDDTRGRIWLNPFSRLGRVGVNAWVKDEQAQRRVVKTVTTLQYPYGPEFSIMRFNEYNVPTEEKYRGWRTALLALIVADVITEGEAERAFGPALGEAAHFYRIQLQTYRRIKLGLEV